MLAPRKRACVALALSLALHAVLLTGFNLHPMPPEVFVTEKPTPPLAVTFLRPAPPPARGSPRFDLDALQRQAREQERGGRQAPLIGPRNLGQAPPLPILKRDTPPTTPAESASASPWVSVESLLDSAKRIARDEAKRIAHDGAKRTPLPKAAGDEDRPVLPGLAKAFRREQAGVTTFHDGSIRVVTPSGKIYCAKPLPEIVAHGGPVEPMVVATGCP